MFERESKSSQSGSELERRDESVRARKLGLDIPRSFSPSLSLSLSMSLIYCSMYELRTYVYVILHGYWLLDVIDRL